MGPNEATDVLRSLIRGVQARFPDTSIGLTGLPVMEDDEMRASKTSMIWASAISFVGVGLLFVSGFGGVRHALMANVILLIGMAWAFGFATASVGHLNILSVTFTATLIGIGIDFGIYFAARYIQNRKLGQPVEEALITTARTAGPSIITGALTTSVAFFAAGLTEFTGVSELGIIAGGGILLCAAAELLLLPAAIAIVDKTEWGRSLPDPLPVYRWIAPFARLPRMTLAAGIAFTIFCTLGLGKLWYDNNLLNMQAVGLESVELERKLLNECNQSVWYGLSIADTRDELLARKAAFLKLPSVERTEEIVSMIPADHAVKEPIIRRIQQRLSGLPERPPLIPVERPEKIGAALGQLEEMLSMAGPGDKCARQIAQIRDQLRRLPLADCYTLVSRFQQQMAGDLLSRLHILGSIANPEPPKLTDLPTSLVDRFVGTHGKHLLKIYGKGNIWDTQALERFVRDVRTVDPHVTGNPLQAYEASLEMKSSYQQAAIYSLLVIVGVLMLDFRNFRDVALASLPLAFGVLQTFGLMGLLDIPVNPANLIALPLILGLGVDYGVHIVHEFREHNGRYRMSPGTAVAVLTDSLTTIVGYGALMIATHQGLQSLGRVLTIGVTMCLFSSLVLLPALLALVTRNRPELSEESEPAEITEPDAGAESAAAPEPAPQQLQRAA
jgi:hopanoid biosynthesis associated RND transporter like protein HpnN